MLRYLLAVERDLAVAVFAAASRWPWRSLRKARHKDFSRSPYTESVIIGLNYLNPGTSLVQLPAGRLVRYVAC
jgi:hypothetical protein